MSNATSKETITILDKTFEKYIDCEDIQQRVEELARRIREDYASRLPIFMVVLNGACMFGSDLIRACNIPCEVCFVKMSSYEGVSSIGQVTVEVPPPANLDQRHIIVIEDIVDTGHTLSQFLPVLERQHPAEVAIASLLVKSNSMQAEVPIAYRGFNISDAFVLGYGLDYNQRGRQLKHIYRLME